MVVDGGLYFDGSLSTQFSRKIVIECPDQDYLTDFNYLPQDNCTFALSVIKIDRLKSYRLIASIKLLELLGVITLIDHDHKSFDHKSCEK